VQYRPTYQLYGHIIGIYRRRVGGERRRKVGAGKERKRREENGAKKEIVRKPR